MMPTAAVLTIIGNNTPGGQIALAAQLIALITITKHRINLKE
jgi:hypothetical protein